MVDRVLVCGPPGGGKSTAARSLADAGFAHLEREMFRSERRFRDAVIASRTVERAAVVRCCFDHRELREWIDMACASRVWLVDPGAREAKARVRERAGKAWKGEMEAVDRWYDGWRESSPLDVAAAVLKRGRW